MFKLSCLLFAVSNNFCGDSVDSVCWIMHVQEETCLLYIIMCGAQNRSHNEFKLARSIINEIKRSLRRLVLTQFPFSISQSLSDFFKFFRHLFLCTT